MVAALQVTTRSAGNEKASRTYRSINPSYITQIGERPLAPAPIDGVTLPGSYETFWEWATAVAQALASLSTSNYDDSKVTAEWNMTEEANA